MEIGQAKICQSVQVFTKFSKFIFQILMDFPKGHSEKASEDPPSFLEGKERKEKEKKDTRKSGRRKEESLTFPQKEQMKWEFILMTNQDIASLLCE